MQTTATRLRRFRLEEKVAHTILWLCSAISILTTLGIVGILVFESYSFFREVGLVDFLTDPEWTPLFVNKHFGILPLLCGTLLISGIAILVAVPLGLLIAVYLNEYAPFTLRSILKPILEILAGIPTIVYGYFALTFLTPLLQNIIPNLSGFNALSPGITLGIMILPFIASLSEDAMAAVPDELRHASYALGGTRLRTAWRTVIPASRSGILAAVILAFSRAIGETMLVTIAAGQRPNLTLNPLVPIETMTAYIVQVSLGDTPTGTIEYQTIFAVGMMLFLLTLAFNLLAFRWKRKGEEYSV